MTKSPGKTVTVEWYAGYRGEETPRRLTLEGRTIEVVAVLERWREPGCRGLLLLGDDGHAYRLRQDAESGMWEAAAVER